MIRLIHRLCLLAAVSLMLTGCGSTPPPATGFLLTGAGTGGASMEGEVIDSVTGEQLAAVVQSGRGNQFELDTFDAVDDVKDVIDRWADEAEERLRELRGAGGVR